MAQPWLRRQKWIWSDPPNLLASTLGGPARAPFALLDWPNPRAASQQAGFVPLNLLTATLGVAVQIPFALSEWPNPARPSQPPENRGFTRGANTQLFGQDKLFGALGEVPSYNWPNPKYSQARQSFDSLNLLATTLGGPVQRPFVLLDWPNPNVPQQPAENRGFTFSGLLATTLNGKGLTPFALLDWPNPRQPVQPLENRGFVYYDIPIASQIPPASVVFQVFGTGSVGLVIVCIDQTGLVAMCLDQTGIVVGP